MDPIRTLVVDDELFVRHALRTYLDVASGVEIVGEAADGRAAVDGCVRLRPDVVLMDLRLPTADGVDAMHGVDAIREIVRLVPDTKALVLTTLVPLRHVLGALHAGAAGYVIKDSHPDTIVQAIVDVHGGTRVLSPSIADALVRSIHAGVATDEGFVVHDPDSLTSRELSIVRLLTRGMSNAEIGHELNLAEATVKANFSRIIAKWGARDRVQVLIHAVRSGLVPL